MLRLREYQEESVQGLREGFADGHRAQMLYLPTGGGKTEIAISMMALAAEKGRRVAMVMDRRVLCDQTSTRMDKYAVDHGVLMAGHWRYRPDRKIQVCSAQTLEVRGLPTGLNLLIVDEAHCSRASINEFIKNHPTLKVVGLSASPFTKGLGEIYTNVVSTTTTEQLVASNQLAPLRVYIAKQIDMAGAKKVAGEWSAAETTKRGVQITGDIVKEWIKKTHDLFGAPRKTAVFCAGVAHGEHLSRCFADAGYNFVSICWKDDEEYKRQVIEDFARPDTGIHGVIATDILTKGWDQADVMLGISARPFSKSFSSHVQQLGRVMRPHADKSEGAVWLDFSGNYLRFRDQWDELYSDGVRVLDDGAEKSKAEPTDKEKEASKCPKCGALWPGKSDMCVSCGHVRMKKNQVEAVAGEMVELGKDEPPREKFSMEYKIDWYAQLLGYAMQRRKNPGMAFYSYKEKFGIGPGFKKPEPKEPGPEVLNWITSKNIAYAKSRAA